ncbi:MAG: hypothetical protein QOG06_722 [Gaiellaceae bacterium]|nr:hypothetical protein [Gaiellaceae bacterium]
MRAVLVVVASLALAAPAQALFVQFRTPSSNIGCVFSSEPGRVGPYLRCDILSGLKPKPPRPPGCTLDWTFGFQMRWEGRATTVCVGDTAVDKRARALRYGSTWSRGGFTCTSRKTGLRCRNHSGHGFRLSRSHSYRF